ncbi:hypothetical protein B0I72DRAFT_116767 [Yarrowia lipolytica]|uniref:YALI0F27687p n=3 Tax=Yarrowia lipolytica TaxID=4952 RepID=Q6C054_YARLI|nr:YALI0F27687p [Yarrowia lipolytica CLIB122]AOW07795.1 hypothetical protein YALI1_F35163g [Yarrowia lipolytica]KAJ8055155.1 hypothetical protein LXG23DRAFT_17028 [Yarrowia lipolytica]QNP99640.1 Hypothetical protein YALI2_E00956g [Yarrowia lipolytica]RDW30606.1 hypothetical protein B0I72DRAFT_116767 [Yarrowia lipolytica]RDW43144.1 hypothetical protein B0I74DRAFT_104191 [Yarrowia lipolytica]|eukprot:XP_505958.1 YALI0F27687p [Yarrowia lipolytica CLIB122]
MTDSESPSPGHDSDTFDRNGSPLSDVSSPADTNTSASNPAHPTDDSSLTDTEASLKAQLAGFVEGLVDDTNITDTNTCSATVVAPLITAAPTTTTTTTITATASTTVSTTTAATTSIAVGAPSASGKSLTPAQSLARKLSEKPPTKLYKKTQTNRRRSPPVATNGPIAIAPAPVLRPLLPKPVVPIRPKKRAKSVGGASANSAAVPTTVAPSAVTQTPSVVRRASKTASANTSNTKASSTAAVNTTISPSSLSLPTKRKSSDVSTDSSLDMMLTPATTLDMSLDMSLSLDISQPNLDFWPDDLEWQDSGITQPKELNLEDIFYDLDEQIIA